MCALHRNVRETGACTQALEFSKQHIHSQQRRQQQLRRTHRSLFHCLSHSFSLSLSFSRIQALRHFTSSPSPSLSCICVCVRCGNERAIGTDCTALADNKQREEIFRYEKLKRIKLNHRNAGKLAAITARANSKFIMFSNK